MGLKGADRERETGVVVERSLEGNEPAERLLGAPSALPLRVGDKESERLEKGSWRGDALEPTSPWPLGTGWGLSGEFSGIKTWRLLWAEGAWLGSGFCLALVVSQDWGSSGLFSLSLTDI